MTHYIQKNYRLSPEKENPPTILYENNAACITQLKRGCIKGHRTKIFHQKLLMIYRTMVKLMYNKFDYVTI